jgi:hypothetical protein
MGPVGRKDVEALLRDGGWLVRAARALVAGDGADEEAPRERELLSRTVQTLEEAVARAELRLDVAEAVLALDEPGRRAVILRLFEAQPLAAIARLTCAPEEVVRTRVRLGVAQVWRALQSRPRGEQAHGRRACSASTALLVARLERLARDGAGGSPPIGHRDASGIQHPFDARSRRWWWLPS